MKLIGAGPPRTATTTQKAAEAWNEEVRHTVPAERLFEWEPQDGWEPLCDFLAVDVPSDPLPNVNDTAAFKEGITGGALAALNEWWERRPVAS